MAGLIFVDRLPVALNEANGCQMSLIYKISSRAAWMEAEMAGRFDGAPVDLRDGFIHFSAADQVAETARRHFSGEGDLLLIAVEAEKSLGMR